MGHRDVFGPFQEELSAYFTVHTPLFSGHGGKELPETGITVEKYTQELHEFITAEGMKEVSLFGHSMGGYVTLCYAMEHPENINSIMTLGTHSNGRRNRLSKKAVC